MRGFVVLAIVALAALTAPLAAQQADTLGPLRSAVMATKPMTRVQVELQGGRRTSGGLAGADSTGFDLSDPAGLRTHVIYADVTRYWERRRAIPAGAIVGGVVGAGVGAFFGMLAVGLCEYDCSGSLTGGAVIGGLLVGAVGAGAGAIVGAAIPRWSLRWRSGVRPTPDSTARPTPAATAPAGQAPAAGPGAPQAGEVPSPGAPKLRQTGEVTFQVAGAYGGTAGYVSGTYVFPDGRGAMAGGTASLGFRYRRLAFGPEVMRFAGSPGVTVVDGLARIDLVGADARAAPYAALGMGAYGWGSWDPMYLGASLGAGVTFGGRRQWRAEARWHTTVQNTGVPEDPAMLTIGAGWRVGW